MPSEGGEARKIDLHVPQEADSGGRRAGNGAGKANKGRIRRKQGKIRRKKDHSLTSQQRPSHQPQGGLEDHEEAGAEGKDGKEEKELQLLHGRCRESRGQPPQETVQGRHPEQGFRDRRDRIQVRMGKGLPFSGDGPPQPSDHRI